MEDSINIWPYAILGSVLFFIILYFVVKAAFQNATSELNKNLRILARAKAFELKEKGVDESEIENLFEYSFVLFRDDFRRKKQKG